MSFAVTVAAVGVGVAGYGAYQASKGSGQSRSTGEISSVPATAYGGQIGKMTDAQFQLNQKQAGLALDLYPQFAGQEREAQLRSAKAMLSLYPEFAAAERQGTRKQREGDLKDLSRLGPQYEALFSQLSPGYAALDGMVAEAGSDSPLLQTMNANAMGGGRSPIREEMERQALYDLSLGGDLSGAEQRDAIQSSRGAWSDRGLAFGNGAISAEVLNTDAARRAREAQRRAYAGSVWGQADAEDQAFRGYGVNVESLNQASRGNRLNAILSAGQAKLSPILASMGRTNVSPAAGSAGMQMAPSSTVPGQVMSTAPQVTQGAQALSPLYDYSGQVFDWNANAAEARAINAANAYSSAGSGLVKAGTDIYAAQLKNKAAGAQSGAALG